MCGSDPIRRAIIRGAAGAALGLGIGTAPAADAAVRHDSSRTRREVCGEMHVYRGGPYPVTYAVYGHGDPVLMITGMASVYEWFHFNIPAMVEAGYQVIAQDLRGANRPDIPAAPGPYTTSDMATDSIGILDELGVHRCDLIALSMGGMVAQQLAISHRERLRRVSIVGNGLARVPEDLPTSTQPAAHGSSRPTDEGADDGLEAALAAAFTPDFEIDKPERYAYFVEMYRRHHARPETLEAQVAAALAHNTMDDLDRITAPVQLIVGELDEINAGHVGEMDGRIRRSELHVMTGMAHGLNLEHADVYNGLVLDFLGRPGRGRHTVP